VPSPAARRRAGGWPAQAAERLEEETGGQVSLTARL